jgi:hypothetical protein
MGLNFRWIKKENALPHKFITLTAEKRCVAVQALGPSGDQGRPKTGVLRVASLRPNLPRSRHTKLRQSSKGSPDPTTDDAHDHSVLKHFQLLLGLL